MVGQNVPFYFYDLNLKFNYIVNSKNRVFFSSYFGDDVLKANANGTDSTDAFGFSFRLGNFTQTLRWSHVFNQKLFSNLSLVFETLAINRANKGYKMSMSMSQLQKIVDTFPKDIVLFGCPQGEHLASAAFCLRLSSEVLYVFYWGDRPEYATFSPVVSVADSIYRYGQAQGFKLLDVGTSTIDIEPNIGLLEFKRSLGFNESLKLVMRKSL